jgi:hypothetical protein
MTQKDPFYAMSIPRGEPTPIPTEADIPLLHPIPIPGGDPNTFQTGENINQNENQGDNNLTSSCKTRQNVGTYKDGPAITHHLPIDNELYKLAHNATLSNVCLHPIPDISNQGFFNDYQPQQKIQQQFLAECYLLQETWFSDPNCFKTFTDSIILDTWDTDEINFSKIKDPHILTACATSSKINEDNPSFNTLTCGPFQVQFWKAMYNKLVTLIQVFDCWDYVPRTPTMKVLPSTLTFEIKCYPDVGIKKFKA